LIQSQESFGLSPDRAIAEQLSALNERLLFDAGTLSNALTETPHGVQQHLRHCADTLLPLMSAIRASADALENLVDDSFWPLPTYQEMLFIR